MDHPPFICGIAVKINGDLQAAVNFAGQRYHEKFGRSPTHVSLPSRVDPDGLNLYGVLGLAYHSGPGVVIVGRPYVR